MTSQFKLGKYAAYVLAIWILLTLLNAAYYFIVPHDPSFGVPLGIKGAFLLFHTFYSVIYLFVTLVVGLILFYKSRPYRDDGAGA